MDWRLGTWLFIFSIGFVLEACLVIRPLSRKDAWPIGFHALMACTAGAFGAIFFHPTEPHLGVLWALSLFAGLHLHRFWKRTLITIDEGMLLTYAIIFLFLLFSNLLPFQHPGAVIALLFPCSIIVAMSMTTWRPDDGTLYGLYSWFLAINLVILWRQLQPAILFDPTLYYSAEHPVVLFLSGMAVFRCITLVFTMLRLLPRHDKNSTQEENDYREDQHKKFMRKRYRFRQVQLQESCTQFIVIGGGLVVNAFVPIVSVNAMIAAAIALFPIGYPYICNLLYRRS